MLYRLSLLPNLWTCLQKDILSPFLLHRDDDGHDVRGCGHDHDDHGRAYGHDYVHDHDRDRDYAQNACVYELNLYLPQVPSYCEYGDRDYGHGHGHDDDRDRGRGDLMQNARSQNISR